MPRQRTDAESDSSPNLLLLRGVVNCHFRHDIHSHFTLAAPRFGVGPTFAKNDAALALEDGRPGQLLHGGGRLVCEIVQSLFQL